MAKDSRLARIASSITGRTVVIGEAPAALITAISESLFMAFSVCAIAMTVANGRTTGITEGRISAASWKKATADWPLSVTRLMRVRICVVQTIASVHSSAAHDSIKARLNM